MYFAAQLRHLIESEHGWLAPSASPPRPWLSPARDQWIGWELAVRRKRLYRVVALSRFLIRPSVRCHLLASKALGRVLRLLPFDFRQCYG